MPADSIVINLGEYWPFEEKNTRGRECSNGCVIWYEDTDSYAVIVTADLKQSAKGIIDTDCLRPAAPL